MSVFTDRIEAAAQRHRPLLDRLARGGDCLSCVSAGPHGCDRHRLVVVPTGPVLDAAEPHDIEQWKAAVCWMARTPANCTIEPASDFGHPPMTLTELVPHLRERAATAARLDDVAVSKRELFMLLDALEGKP